MDSETIDSGFVPRLRSGVELVAMQDEAVLFEEETGRLHQLDPIASLVCRCFDGETSIASVAKELGEGFGEEPSAIERDVLAMVTQLGRLGLLEGIDGTADAAADVLGEGGELSAGDIAGVGGDGVD